MGSSYSNPVSVTVEKRLLAKTDAAKTNGITDEDDGQYRSLMPFDAPSYMATNNILSSSPLHGSKPISVRVTPPHERLDPGCARRSQGLRTQPTNP